MGAFFKMMFETGSRNRAADVFKSCFENEFSTTLPENLYKCYKGCLLAIHAGSNKGSIEDCVRILYRDIDSFCEYYVGSPNKIRYFLNQLKQECYDGNTEKYNYGWAITIIDEYLLRY